MEEQEEVVEEADEGELLVLRRALSGPRGQSRAKAEHLSLKVHGSRQGVLLDHRWRELCKCSLTYYGKEAQSSSYGTPVPLQHLMAQPR